jgi:hypothetical protein
MRRLVVVFALLAVLAIAGTVVSRLGAGHSRANAASTSTVSDQLPDDGSTSASTASAAGDIDAARRAGIAAVSLTDEVVKAGFISRRELIGSFTTIGYGSRLADETSQAVTAMLLELGERDADTSKMAVLEQPITATAQRTPAGARVMVWSVLVVAVPGVGPGRQVWRTVTLEMVDVDGRWLVDNWASTPGPTPAPAAEAAFDDATVVAGPLGWKPAVAETVS